MEWDLYINESVMRGSLNFLFPWWYATLALLARIAIVRHWEQTKLLSTVFGSLYHDTITLLALS